LKYWKRIFLNHGNWAGPSEQCRPSAVFKWPMAHAAHYHAPRSPPRWDSASRHSVHLPPLSIAACGLSSMPSPIAPPPFPTSLCITLLVPRRCSPAPRVVVQPPPVPLYLRQPELPSYTPPPTLMSRASPPVSGVSLRALMPPRLSPSSPAAGRTGHSSRPLRTPSPP
jgi:hypothetical protein